MQPSRCWRHGPTGRTERSSAPPFGYLALHPTVFPMPEQPELQMIVYTPLTGEDTAAKLRALMTQEDQCDKMIS
jgi:hypothetical protein